MTNNETPLCGKCNALDADNTVGRNAYATHLHTTIKPCAAYTSTLINTKPFVVNHTYLIADTNLLFVQSAVLQNCTSKANNCINEEFSWSSERLAWSNEELACTNEEFVWSNKELACTNGRLAWLNKELACTNERLAWLSEELVNASREQNISTLALFTEFFGAESPIFHLPVSRLSNIRTIPQTLITDYFYSGKVMESGLNINNL